MLQGGDPTGTGSGGDSHFGGTFKVFYRFFIVNFWLFLYLKFK